MSGVVRSRLLRINWSRTLGFTLMGEGASKTALYLRVGHGTRIFNFLAVDSIIVAGALDYQLSVSSLALCEFNL